LGVAGPTDNIKILENIEIGNTRNYSSRKAQAGRVVIGITFTKDFNTKKFLLKII
jgi:hypothetical protein